MFVEGDSSKALRAIMINIDKGDNERCGKGEEGIR